MRSPGGARAGPLALDGASRGTSRGRLVSEPRGTGPAWSPEPYTTAARTADGRTRRRLEASGKIGGRETASATGCRGVLRFCRLSSRTGGTGRPACGESVQPIPGPREIGAHPDQGVFEKLRPTARGLSQANRWSDRMGFAEPLRSRRIQEKGWRKGISEILFRLLASFRALGAFLALAQRLLDDTLLDDRLRRPGPLEQPAPDRRGRRGGSSGSAVRRSLGPLPLRRAGSGRGGAPRGGRDDGPPPA